MDYSKMSNIKTCPECGSANLTYDAHLGEVICNDCGSVIEDPTFGLRACAPALACNKSYRDNGFINWDPKKMKLK